MRRSFGVGFAEAASGVAQVDVVERRPRHRDGRHAHSRGVECRQHRGDARGASVGTRAQRRTFEHDVVHTVNADERGGRPAVRLRLGELDLDRVTAQLGLELVGRALGHDEAAVDDRELRGEPVRLLEVMRGQEDRQAPFVGEARDLLPHRRPHLGIEAGRRLVEEEHPWPVDQAQGDVEPPLHAARIGAGQTAGGLREPEPLEQLVDAPPELGARKAVNLALEDEILATRCLRIEARALADDADDPSHPRGVAQDVDPGHPSLARVGA
jgi:hypothetical protein